MMMSQVRRMIAGLVRMILIGYGVHVSNLITTGHFKLGLNNCGNPALYGDLCFPCKCQPAEHGTVKQFCKSNSWLVGQGVSGLWSDIQINNDYYFKYEDNPFFAFWLKYYFQVYDLLWYMPGLVPWEMCWYYQS